MATATRDSLAEHPIARSPRSTWMVMARTGAIVMAVFAVALQATARTIILPVAVIGLVFLAFIPFLQGERRWVGLAAAVFGVAAYVGNLPIILDDLRNPESAPSFILQLLSTIGVFLVAVGGIGAFFGPPARWARPLALAAAGVFIAGTVGSVALAANTDSAARLPDDVQVTAQQLMWTPEDVVITTGNSGIWIENRDGIRHTFTIPDLDIDVEIPALKARRFDIDAAPGTYLIICTVPGHESMTGTLTITD
jgi:plastocyanin